MGGQKVELKKRKPAFRGLRLYLFRRSSLFSSMSISGRCPMKKSVGRDLRVWCASVILIQLLCSRALAVDTMADWVGLNNTQTRTGVWTDFDKQVLGGDGLPGHDENFAVISPTSIGGTVQAKINYNQSPNNEQPLGTSNVNAPHVYLADQSLDGPALDFTSTLHMDGTIAWDS